MEKTSTDTSLAFRLPSSVQMHSETGGLSLVLSYPLKFIRLDKFWQPVFTHLSSNENVSFKKLASLTAQIDPLTLEFFLGKLVRGGFLEQQGTAHPKVYPSVSIIIPVRNRPQEIRACLSSLAKLNYPSGKIEIIVVDDCSSDSTPDVVREFPVTLLAMKKHRQASFCRNIAARHAKNEIIAFIDSDCEADPDWLLDLTPAFREKSIAAVGGMIDSFYTINQLDQYEKVQSSLMISSWYKRSSELDHFFYVPSCNFLIRRDCFKELGGFKNDLHVGEDVDLCWRIQNSGLQVDYRPVGTIFHKHRNRLQAFCRRRFDYGTSEPQLQKLHKDRRKRMVFPPLTTVFWLAMAWFLFTGDILLALPTLSLPLLSSLSMYRKIRGTNKHIGFFKVMFAVLRSYTAWLYHLCAFVSRYYILCSMVFIVFLPLLFCGMAVMHIIACLGQYIIKKPHLSFFVFFFYFSLEQMSYQAGVWWSCIQNKHFGSILPKLVFSVKHTL
jgi:mycofactocin system glycosyltransferase